MHSTKFLAQVFVNWSIVYFQGCASFGLQLRDSVMLSRQECWSGLPCPLPGHLSNLGIKPASFASTCIDRQFSFLLFFFFFNR